MKTNYVLIDYENVQPDDLELLQNGTFKVKVLLGPNQGKIPLPLASALQPLGSNVEYIHVGTQGRNALDFYIAYYLGVLSTEDPSAYLHVISKDRGFDQLITHLREDNKFARRSERIIDMPAVQQEIAFADLVRRGDGKPGTQKTLLNTWNTLFEGKLSKQQLLALLESMCKKGIINLEGTKIAYALETAPLATANQ